MSLPAVAAQAVLVKSSDDNKCLITEVRGIDFDQFKFTSSELIQSFLTSGFQATNLGYAIEEINKMIKARQQKPKFEPKLTHFPLPFERRKRACTIFFGYTSNMVSSGVREVIKFLAKHDLVDCIVSSAGGVEEDFIKCMAPTYLGDFKLDGRTLRKQGINRIGNLLEPNDNYCLFEDWIMPIFDDMLKEQKENGQIWSPCKVIHRLGKEINHEDSIYYWTYKNNIPVFCPGLTDGSLGDMLYFHSYKNPGLIIDVNQDIRYLNDMSTGSASTGIIILGGGLVKHHICNANLMRNGANYSVFVNTGQEFDGSDSGASPDEAISWGKIRMDARPVKVSCDATIAFPLIVAETFAKFVHENKNKIGGDC